MKTSGRVLAILYGKGGLGDVGRHAILAALETDVASVKVFSQHPETLEEENYKCGCLRAHTFTVEEQKRIEIIPVKNNWKEDLSAHFDGITAVVSCLGTRQPFLGDRYATAGSKAVKKAMEAHDISRVVSMTSMGLGEDFPCMEFHFAGKIMDVMFSTICRREANDLLGSEQVYKESNLDYLLVRPVGLGEDVEPKNEWFIQKEKHKDVVGTNIAKMDLGRFMVQEALKPTRHRTAVVVGGDPEKDDQLTEILEKRKDEGVEGFN